LFAEGKIFLVKLGLKLGFTCQLGWESERVSPVW
jgi:hypothetical protein